MSSPTPPLSPFANSPGTVPKRRGCCSFGSGGVILRGKIQHRRRRRRRHLCCRFGGYGQISCCCYNYSLADIVDVVVVDFVDDIVAFVVVFVVGVGFVGVFQSLSSSVR